VRDELALRAAFRPTVLLANVADLVLGLHQTQAYKSGKAEDVVKAIPSAAFARRASPRSRRT
jgi:hypothetical protein